MDLRGKFGKHERDLIVALGGTTRNSSFSDNNNNNRKGSYGNNYCKFTEFRAQKSDCRRAF